MTQQELEERLGRKVSQEEYVNANAIYMAWISRRMSFAACTGRVRASWYRTYRTITIR